MVKAIPPESQDQMGIWALGENDGDTHFRQDEGLDAWNLYIRLGDKLDISRLMIRTGHLNQAFLCECLNGDCPSLNAIIAMALEPEYQTRQRSLNSSRWKLRTTHGAWESHVQGEVRQVFQL